MMLSNTGRDHNKVGDAVRADGYYGSTDGIHTVQVVYSNFTGSFGIQATLATEPTESDWFYININSRANTSSETPFVSYPKNPLEPTGRHGDNGTEAFTFVGNFVWLRAVLDRSDLPEPPGQSPDWDLGQIDKVLLSL
jgi:hypothetical protein